MKLTKIISWLRENPDSLAYWQGVACQGKARGYSESLYLKARLEAAFCELPEKDIEFLGAWILQQPDAREKVQT